MQVLPKTVLITGCANGIGRHLTETFYAQGYQIMAVDIEIGPLLYDIDGVWDKKRYVIEPLDVTDPIGWDKIMGFALQVFGKIDIFINNAGVIVPGFMADITLEDIDKQVDTNLKGVMYGSKFATDLFLKQGFGHLINVASLAGVAPIEGLSVYSATKFGVRAFSLAIAQELRAKNIYVSVFCPDLVNTQMLTDQLEHEAANITFSGERVLSVEEITATILHRAVKNKELEILYPRYRGFLAKLGNSFPKLSAYISRFMAKKGNQQRLKIREERQQKLV
ncbi:MAG: SDR family oxidoreductase [Cytophagia bacterium]|nr:MAG: SDR family oxidoreductase [Cytophagales bacterium]TAG40570.1 MAG: SDR family oxidoreductase [Cytophagia bacterium]TAG69384.1 MAG: SDR family oxidoreductase [Runella slithyformis]TAG83614.1 MAG: SDR family oxidoreductase [Cytophagales bacterium]